jgi:hypothetical protein
MPMNMPPIWRVLGLALLVSTGWAQSQTAQPSGGEPSYLMRIERVRAGLDLCVLLRGDGQYHLERHLPEKSKVFEGNLGAAELHQVIRIVSDDQLFLLQQNQISDQMLGSKFDNVRLAVLRPRNRWQALAFPDPISREPYRKSLDPLLNWLEKLEKLKGRELPEDSGRTNCSVPQDLDLTLRTRGSSDPASPVAALNDPPKGSAPQLKARGAQDTLEAVPQLKTRPAQNPESAKNIATTVVNIPQASAKKKQYLVRIVESFLYPRVEKATCSIIASSGQYHAVTQSHDPGSSKVHSAVLDGHLKEEELTALAKILDDPELSRVSTHESPDSSFVPQISRSGISISISFMREGTTYDYEISRSFQSIGRSTDKAQE